jgi:hypothetical protein
VSHQRSVRKIITRGYNSKANSAVETVPSELLFEKIKKVIEELDEKKVVEELDEKKKETLKVRIL